MLFTYIHNVTTQVFVEHGQGCVRKRTAVSDFSDAKAAVILEEQDVQIHRLPGNVERVLMGYFEKRRQCSVLKCS